MTTRRKNSKFKLIRIAAFDARKGYKRCSISEVCVKEYVDPSFTWLRPVMIKAHFWRSKAGKLVVRFFSYYQYNYHYEVTLANGKVVPEKDINELAEYITDILSKWRGSDDSPEEFI
jgi:hypothetical protein